MTETQPALVSWTGRCEKIDLAYISSEPKCMPKPRQSFKGILAGFFPRPKLLHVSKPNFSHLPVHETLICERRPNIPKIWPEDKFPTG